MAEVTVKEITGGKCYQIGGKGRVEFDLEDGSKAVVACYIEPAPEVAADAPKDAQAGSPPLAQDPPAETPAPDDAKEKPAKAEKPAKTGGAAKK